MSPPYCTTTPPTQGGVVRGVTCLVLRRTGWGGLASGSPPLTSLRYLGLGTNSSIRITIWTPSPAGRMGWSAVARRRSDSDARTWVCAMIVPSPLRLRTLAGG